MTGDFDLSTAGNMKSLLFVVIAYASLVAVFVPAGVNGQQSNGDSECLFRLGLDNQCLDMFDTSTTSVSRQSALLVLVYSSIIQILISTESLLIC